MAQDELDPRHAALPEVRSHHVRDRPALQVRALEQRVEDDLPAGAREPRPEVDVLDGGKRVALCVEPAHAAKRIRADRPEAGPERRCLAGALLVDVVVQEIAELRDGARVGGGVVVRAEDGGEPGSASNAARIRPNASACGSTSASTKTTTSPVASAAPAFLAAAGPSPSVTTTSCSGGSSAAAIASRHAASVGGSFVAGMTAVSVAIGR